MTLAEFLRARLDEDEDDARGEPYPVRPLAEVDAKRRIVHAHDREHECTQLTGSGDHSVVDGRPWELWEGEHTSVTGEPCYTLRLLALPYDDHPDYDPAWRP